MAVTTCRSTSLHTGGEYTSRRSVVTLPPPALALRMRDPASPAVARATAHLSCSRSPRPGSRPGLASVRSLGASPRSAQPAGKRSRGDEVAGAWSGVADSGDGGKGAITAADPSPAGWVGSGPGRASLSSPSLHSGPLPASPKGVAFCPRSWRLGPIGWGGRWGRAASGGPGGASRPAWVTSSSGFDGGCERFGAAAGGGGAVA